MARERGLRARRRSRQLPSELSLYDYNTAYNDHDKIVIRSSGYTLYLPTLLSTYMFQTV
jgi:hypothetical protein